MTLPYHYPPKTLVIETVARDDRHILIEDDIILDGDVLALTDFYPGQSTYEDYSTYDVGKVIHARGRLIEIERETPLAHPCRSRVRVISRRVPYDTAFRP